jgi:hypothetical protein
MRSLKTACRISLVIAAIYFFWIAVSLILFVAASLLPDQDFFAAAIIGAAVFFHICLASLATAFFLVHAMEPLRARHRLRSVFIGFCLALTGIIYFRFRQMDPGTPELIWLLKILNTANLVVFASLLGSWITAPLKRPAELVPVCVVMVLADMFSVFRGPSREIIESLTVYYETGMVGPPPLADFLLVKITVPGFNHLMPVFGVSDWIIVAFFSAAAVKFGFRDSIVGRNITEMLSKGRPGFYLPISAMGLFIAVQAAHLMNVFLPALPLVVFCFMLFTLIRHPEARRLKRSDWLASGGAAAIMFCLMLIYGRLS